TASARQASAMPRWKPSALNAAAPPSATGAIAMPRVRGRDAAIQSRAVAGLGAVPAICARLAGLPDRGEAIALDASRACACAGRARGRLRQFASSVSAEEAAAAPLLRAARDQAAQPLAVGLAG